MSFIKVEKASMVFLVLSLCVLGIFSILSDFNLIPFTLTVNFIVGIVFSGLVVTETYVSVKRRKKFGVAEIISAILVLVTLLVILLDAVGTSSSILSAVSGTVKALLIITAVSLVFLD